MYSECMNKNPHLVAFDAYIEDLRSALNEHTVDRVEDLPAALVRQMTARAALAGYLSDDPDEWAEPE